MESQTKVKQIWKVAETAADTTYSEIAKHIDSIERVSWAIGERYECTSAALEALEAVRNMCRNMRRLQQVQRNGYSHQADDGIHTLATSYISAVVRRVEWPKQAGPWLESIMLSCAKIGASTRQRQEAHRNA